MACYERTVRDEEKEMKVFQDGDLSDISMRYQLFMLDMSK
jgi:hypothetical protein